MAKKPVWLGLHWLMLGVTAVLLVLVATFVDLKKRLKRYIVNRES